MGTAERDDIITFFFEKKNYWKRREKKPILLNFIKDGDMELQVLTIRLTNAKSDLWEWFLFFT